MSQYTTELRYLLEAEGFTLALNEYPVFDEDYRGVINGRITDHYYFREIGQETADRFNWFLRTRMNEIMPRYNKLYLSESLIINPLYGSDLTETHTRSATGTTTGAANSSANQGVQRTIMQESDTPQGYISPSTISGGGYMNKANIAEQTSPTPSTGAQETSGTASSAETFVRSVVGFDGADQADKLEKYRSTLLNIDMMLVAELNDLFMIVY